MQITKINIYQSRIPLKNSFVISLGALSHAENVIVTIETDEGIVGTGECSPFRTIHGESMETCFVIGKFMAAHLLTKNPRDIESCSLLMDALIYGNSSIKSAFDMALYDIQAQFHQVPLHALLGGKNDRLLQTDYTVSFGSAEQMAYDAVQIVQDGFAVVKLKLGGTLREDLERMQAIRIAIGFDIPLRIDANQGWDVDTAAYLLKAFEPYRIEFCEEPIPKWNFMALPQLKKESPIMLMADESCCDEHDAARLIATGACDAFNVKLGKSSGIFKALKVIDLASKAGLKMQLGGFLESRLGFTAIAHLAQCSEQIAYFDFDTPLMFASDPVLGGITYHEKGMIAVPNTVGLGAIFDPNYLSSLPMEVVQ